MKHLLLQILLFLSLGVLASCMQAHADDDLRGIPVTNNPNILPRTRETAQGAMFSN